MISSEIYGPTVRVSNPISGEVGAAASDEVDSRDMLLREFQTPSAGRWVLQQFYAVKRGQNVWEFQTPSAGRWVLQPVVVRDELWKAGAEFQTPSAGRWVLQPASRFGTEGESRSVSNPISGEVGAAAP